jgi:hypothetical protein
VSDLFWPKTGTIVRCFCMKFAHVAKRPPEGPLDAAPPFAVCPTGHVSWVVKEGGKYVAKKPERP